MDKLTMILRNKLLDTIDLSDCKVVTIVAPAGYGKSTLVDQLVSGVEQCVARVNLDSFQYSVLDLIVVLLEELSSLSGDFMELRSRITSMDPSRVNTPAVIRNMISLINKVDLSQVVIVIEDLHEIQDHPESINLLDVALKRTDPKIKFILTSRKKLAVSLIDLASRNLIRHVDEKDLQFSKKEITELLTEINTSAPSDELTKQINFITEGWPVLVTLLCGDYGKKILKSKQNELSHMITIGYVFDFLMQEIYGTLDHNEMELLIHTWPFASVDLFEVGLVFGLDKKHINKLLNSGLPIRKVGEKDFSVHPLFREMLKRKYFDDYNSVDNQKWEKIKEIGLAAGSARSIIEFYLNIDELQNCEKYFSSNFDQLIEIGELGFIEKVISYLERSGLDELEIEYYRACILYNAGKLQDAYDLLRFALLSQLNCGADPKNELSLLFCRSIYKLQEIRLFLDTIDHTLDQLLEKVNNCLTVKENFRLSERRLALSLRSELYSRDGKITPTFLEEYKKLLLKNDQNDPIVTRRLIAYLTYLNSMFGTYAEHFEIIEKHATAEILDTSDSVILNNIAVLNFEVGDYQNAFKLAKKALLMQSICSIEFDRHVVYETYSFIYSYFRRNMKAECVIRKCIDKARAIGDKTIEIEMILSLSDLYRRRNRPKDALQLSRDTFSKVKKLNSAFLLYRSLVCRLLPHSASEKIIVGSNFFPKVRQRLSGNYKYIHFKIDFLEAIYARQNFHANANNLFDDVVRRAKENLYNHFFIEESEIHLDMYLDAYDRGTEKEYIRSSLIARGDNLYPKFIDRFLGLSQKQQQLIIEILTSSDSRSAVDASRKIMGFSQGEQKQSIRQHLEKNTNKQTEDKNIKFLTKRETEILELIAKGYSNSELARDLFISDKTVKTHNNRIFFKLGVKSRQEAIRAFKRSASVKKAAN